MLFMGLDVGTQGVRCVVADEKGQVRAAQSVAFQALNAAEHPGWYEQRPGDWAAAMEQAVGSCMAKLKAEGVEAGEVAAISIDGTSGTIVPLDKANRPLSNALMYNDPRAGAQAKETQKVMAAHQAKLGLRFGASFSQPRILWIGDNWPDIYEKTALFAHQADYVAGLLCGEYRVSDYSNALKTGYDLLDERWPDQVAQLGLDVGKLPRIVRPGEPIARVSQAAAEKLGLSTGTWVSGGSTDGYASALAAGAVSAGQWASIIGTTFVLKGVTRELVIDPDGSSYSHRLPSGEWMLGGAANIGGRCLNAYAGDRADFAQLDRQARELVPTGARCYPLTGKGERFPFVDPQAQAFYRGDILGGKLYPALMEGVGFAERLAFDKMAALGCPVGDVINAAGGACRSQLWLEIRSSILNRQLAVPRVVDAAMGSALLAAAPHFGSLAAAAQAMIAYDKRVDPRPQWAAAYQDIYQAFVRDAAKLYKMEG